MSVALPAAADKSAPIAISLPHVKYCPCMDAIKRLRANVNLTVPAIGRKVKSLNDASKIVAHFDYDIAERIFMRCYSI